jgi:predicted HAD superfamily Cof-like phosphohydrolase
MHYQDKVKEFMSLFGQACPSKPELPDVKTRILRVKLLLEEVLELTEASGLKIIDSMGFEFNKDLLSKPDGMQIVENSAISPDIVEVADALADISYVNYGAANAYGINLEPIEDEVHSSNMTKLFTYDEAMRLDPRDFTSKPVRSSGKCILVKNKDGKVQKSPSYETAKIKSLIDQQSNG